MTVIWEKRTDTSLYQIRTAGRTVRLYTDGVFHSQYNPQQIVTRSVWDLLSLPALLQPTGHVQRVLILGLGGGVVVHHLNAFVRPASITAVELSKEHIAIARRFFKVKYKNTKLIHADAIEWLTDYQGEKFDLIIDDLYGEQDGEPVRAVAMDSDWMAVLIKNIKNEGMIVANFVTAGEFKACGYFMDKKIKRSFSEVFVLTTRFYQNHVGVFLRCARGRTFFKEHCQQHKELQHNGFKQTFRMRKIK